MPAARPFGEEEEMKRTVSELADELSLIGRNGFLTCESRGLIKPHYQVVIRFDSLEESQEFHEALYDIINRAEVKRRRKAGEK